jgi:hypothetical protein
MAKTPKLPSQNALAMRLKAAAKPRPMPKAKPKAADMSAIDRANRSQAMEAREARAMGVGGRSSAKLKATPAEAAAIDRANRAQAREAQVIRTTVRERPSPTRKK